MKEGDWVRFKSNPYDDVYSNRKKYPKGWKAFKLQINSVVVEYLSAKQFISYRVLAYYEEEFIKQDRISANQLKPL